MINEKSFGSLIFIREDSKIFYLLLYRKAHEHYKELWDFPRGLVESNEKPKDVVIREVFEETGINDLKFIKGFKETIKWFYKKDNNLIKKQAVYFLAETKTRNVKLSKEHDNYKWCSFEDAMKIINFKNTKEILIKADKFLKNSLTNYF